MFDKLKEFFSNDIPQTEIRSLDVILSELIDDMVHVEGGSFVMGSDVKKKYDLKPDYQPPHKVTVSSFKIGKYQVRQELWTAVMGENPSKHKGDFRLPVDNVSWYDCMSFIEKLNKLLPIKDMEFRLPTEAEWEYASRGGNKSKGFTYPGSNKLSEVAWYNCKHTKPVGKKLPNELGLYDMSGNVQEWCSDWYDSGYYYESPEDNPTGPLVGSYRMKVKRGCDFLSKDEYFQVWCRGGGPQDRKDEGIGLRIVLSPPRPSVPLTKRNLEEILNDLVNDMVYVEGGSYIMGDEMHPDRFLPHRVFVSSFNISKYQVTQEEWEAILGNNPAEYKGEPRNPVECVSWDDCQNFIERLNELTGLSFRMPTEAEWEYAAKGGNRSQRYIYAGSNDLDEVAWYDNNSRSKPHPVGKKKANELGLYDMIGNVQEWCSDWYDRNYYVFSAEDNPTGPKSDQEGLKYKVSRGGSWRLYQSSKDTLNYSLIARRDYQHKDERSNEVGFRLALSSMSHCSKSKEDGLSKQDLSRNMNKLKDILLGKIE